MLANKYYIERTTMTEDFQQLLYENILDEEHFVSATFSGRRRGEQPEWEKLSFRPVVIKDKRHLQISYWDGRQDFTKNYADDAVYEVLRELIDAPYNNFFVRTTREDVQIRISKKGKVMLHRSEPVVLNIDLEHNRSKLFPLPEGTADPFLQASGIMGTNGKVKANKRAKYTQINRFLQLVNEWVDFDEFSSEDRVRILDCGCGSAYLTFAAHHYLNYVLQQPTSTIGIDINADLLSRHQKTIENMGWDNIQFDVSSIIDYETTEAIDIVFALHACDTATDEALAQAIWAQSKSIF